MLQKFLIFLLLCLFSCSSKKEISIKGVAMGIPYSVKIREGTISKEEAEQIIDHCFLVIDSTVNGWNSSSEIARWNASKSCKPIAISSTLVTVLQLAEEAYKETHGFFDPSLGKAISQTKKLLKIGKLLSKEERLALSASCGWDKVLLAGHTLQKKHPDVEIDLDGISKGYFCDLCAEKLREKGAEDLLVEWGGEVKALGGPFLVLCSGITQTIHNEALATSGYKYQLYPIQNGSTYTIYSHFIDPISLSPIPVDKLKEEITYKHPSCAMADALSTHKQLTINSL